MMQDSDKPRRGRKLQQHFTTLVDYPTERCGELPEAAELMISMKFVRKIRLNRKKKYRAVLSDGILEMHNPKHITSNAFSLEYLIDLARVGLQYDEQRLVVKLQTETLFLYPLTISLEKFCDIMHKHRLWRQEKTAELAPACEKKSNREINVACSSARSPARSPTTACSMDSIFTTETTDSLNPFQDIVKSVHSTSLAVLDISSQNLEKMILIADGIKELIEQLKQNAAASQQMPEFKEGTKFSLKPDVLEKEEVKTDGKFKPAESKPTEDKPAEQKSPVPKESVSEEEEKEDN